MGTTKDNLDDLISRKRLELKVIELNFVPLTAAVETVRESYFPAVRSGKPLVEPYNVSRYWGTGFTGSQSVPVRGNPTEQPAPQLEGIDSEIILRIGRRHADLLDCRVVLSQTCETCA